MRTHRFLNAALLVVALLFSQWAVAMHACAATAPVAFAKASAPHDPCCPDPIQPNTCDQHCAFGQSAVDHAKSFAPLDVTLGPALAVRLPGHARLQPRVDRPPVVAPDPPPSIRFSVLRV